MTTEPRRIAIPLDERGMPIMSAELITQIKPLLNTKALVTALANAAQGKLKKEEA